MSELDHREGRVLKNWCFQTMVLEKTLESPLDSKEMKSVNLKGNQPYTLIGRTNAKAQTPILWLPDAKNCLIGKHPDAGKDWRQKKRATGDEMVGWHHQFNRHELRQTPGDGEGQGSLLCWVHEVARVSDLATEQQILQSIGPTTFSLSPLDALLHLFM